MHSNAHISTSRSGGIFIKVEIPKIAYTVFYEIILRLRLSE